MSPGMLLVGAVCPVWPLMPHSWEMPSAAFPGGWQPGMHPAQDTGPEHLSPRNLQLLALSTWWVPLLSLQLCEIWTWICPSSAETFDIAHFQIPSVFNHLYLRFLSLC